MESRSRRQLLAGLATGLLAPLARAHDIVATGLPAAGVPGEWGTVAGELFMNPAPLPATLIPGAPELVSDVAEQMGLARGHAQAVNGLVIANHDVEELDDDGAAVVGGLGGAGDAVLAASMAAAFAIPAPVTKDAAILKVPVTNDAAVDVEIVLSYSFVTFEDPFDFPYADAFAIYLDGNLIAGGMSNLGPCPGTDPWFFVASSVAPFEFQSAAPALWTVPAHTTQRRRLALDLTPGDHVLEFHVADTIDGLVPSALFLGAETYHALAAGATGVCPPAGQAIDYVGHPAAFAPDFGVEVTGGPPFAPAYLIVGTDSVALEVGGFAPGCDIFAWTAGGPLILFAGFTNAFGDLVRPAPVLGAGIAGIDLYFQWFFTAPVLGNTPGLRQLFGPP